MKELEKIKAKAKMYGDTLNEDLILMMLEAKMPSLDLKEREELVAFFNNVLKAKEEAKLSS